MVRMVLIRAAVLGMAAIGSVVGVSAADMTMRTEHRRHPPVHRAVYVEQNRVIHCTTTSVLGFLTTSNCGQGFDPLGTATN